MDQQTDSLPDALREYVADVASLAEASNVNLFWERQLAAVAPLPEEVNREALKDRVESFYGFERLPEGVTGPDNDPDYLRILELRDALVRDVRHPDRSAIGAGQLEFEHLRSLDFLRRRGLLEDYLAFIAPLGIRSSMPTARHYYYAHTLDQLIGEHLTDESLDILEIGAGAGNLACFLQRLGRARSYCIVDLPEMLIHSGFTVSEHVPAAELTFNRFRSERAAEARTPFTFIADSRADLVPEASFDLCLDFNSLSEMDQRPRDDYLELIYQAARPGALFFNVNRRVRAVPQRDGSTFDNNPLLFPYRTTDRVLEWEEDDFQQETRSAFGYTPSLAVRRAALI
jgi:putative sugar O-methyltransferase